MQTPTGRTEVIQAAKKRVPDSLFSGGEKTTWFKDWGRQNIPPKAKPKEVLKKKKEKK